MDEYNTELTEFRHPEYSNRICRLKKLTKPALRRLNKWSDLKSYRNHVLAHNFRLKGESLFSNERNPIHFNIPTTNSEMVLMSEILKIITICVSKEFPEFVFHISSEQMIDRMKFDYNPVNINEEVIAIWSKINEVQIDAP